VFVASIIVAGVVLLASEPAFMVGLAVALAAFSVLWLVSLALRNASIVDIFWGPGIVLVGWLYHLMASPRTRLGLLVCALATAWGLRLAGHVAVRNAGAAEDFRYRQWRERSGPAFWWVSLFKVFLLQAVSGRSSPAAAQRRERAGARYQRRARCGRLVLRGRVRLAAARLQRVPPTAARSSTRP
jgi:hypothetical protein